MNQMLKLVRMIEGDPVCMDVYFTEMMNKIGDMPSLVIGVCGVQRTGKSFLMELVKKAIKDESVLEKAETVIGGPSSIQFKFGKKPCTSDIEIWSEPFIFDAEDGKKWAILLVDTRGLFDNETPPKVGHFIMCFLAMFCDILVYNVKEFNMNDFANLVRPVAMCDEEKPTAAVDKSIVYILDRDAVEGFGYQSQYFDQEGLLKNHQELVSTIKKAFSKNRFISFPEPPKFVKKASWEKPITLGNGSPKVDEEMSEFLDYVKVFVNLLKKDIKQLMLQPPHPRFRHFTTFAKNAKMLSHDMKRDRKLFWNLLAKIAQSEVYFVFLTQLDKVQDGSLESSQQRLKEIQKEADRSLREKLKQQSDNFILEEIQKLDAKIKPQIERKIFQLQIMAFERRLNSLFVKQQLQLKTCLGSDQLQNRYNTFKAQLSSQGKQIKKEIFGEAEILNNATLPELRCVIQSYKTKLEEIFEEYLGSYRLHKVRDTIEKKAKQIAAKGSEALLQIANGTPLWESLDSMNNLKQLKKPLVEPAPLYLLFNPQIQKIKKDFMEAINEVLNENPQVNRREAQRIITEVYEGDVFQKIKMAMTEATEIVKKRLKERLATKAKKSPFKDYLLQLLVEG